MWFFSQKSSADTVARRDIAALREDLEALKAAHERLRGRFYASAAHKAPAEPTEAPQSKAEILRAAGFVPGKPMNHRS